jgi:hypothetical protein
MSRTTGGLRVRQRIQKALAGIVMPDQGWGCTIQPCYRAVREGRVLFVTLVRSTKGWMALAVDTVLGSENLTAVLNDHQHAAIVENEPDYWTTCQAVEAFARKWKSGGVGFEGCSCEPMGAP